MSTLSSLTTNGLVKTNLADRLRREIVTGSLAPGERIVEGKWAVKFGVAQGSIREAINILMQDGFITKESGRSARVINLSEGDVAHLYDLRGAIEGLAAQLAAVAQPDFRRLQAAVHNMREAALAGKRERPFGFDLPLPVELWRLSQ